MNKLEIAVLEAIAAQYPEWECKLLAQFRAAKLKSRENTGAGFFTYLTIDSETASPVGLVSPIGNVWFDIKGFQDPMNFLVFLKNGCAAFLEGAAIRDNTSNIDFDLISFVQLEQPS